MSLLHQRSQPKGEHLCCFFRIKNEITPFYPWLVQMQMHLPAKIIMLMLPTCESQLVFLKLVLNEDIVKTSLFSSEHYLFLLRVTGVPAANT